MTAALNRQAFFSAVRATPFGGALSQGQVTGMEALLDACPLDLESDPLAYCLATGFWETGRTMLPIKERGGEVYFTRMYDITGERPAKARELGNVAPGDGAAFCGRGLVQLTGRANYRRATRELQARGYLASGLDLTVAPDMAMTPDVAAAVMYLGMTEGWFTGRKLSDYFGPGKSNPVAARAIINGKDKAEEIAGFFAGFRNALRLAGHAPGVVVIKAPVPPVVILGPTDPVKAAPAPAVTPPADDLLARFGRWFDRVFG